MASRSPRRTSLIKRVLNEVVDPRRAKWAERSLWAALWCKEGSKPLHSFWPNFLLVAEALRENDPLQKISLMAEIADRTVSLATD